MSDYSTTIKLSMRNEVCNDEVIGEFITDGKKLQFKRHKDYNKIFISTKEEYSKKYNKDMSLYKVMVILLESPHKNEFEIKNLMNINNEKVTSRPANGRTGKNIANMIDEKINTQLEGKLKKYNYLVYVVNAVQKQCSLGIKTTFFRDYIWLTQWAKSSIRQDLSDRIEKINPDLIINCCTNGKHQNFKIEKGKFYFLKNESIVTQKFLKGIGYKIKRKKQKNNIYSHGKLVLSINKGNNIRLKDFIKYMVNDDVNLKNVNYEELSHPSSWK